MGKKYLFRLGSKKNSDANGLSKTINSTRVNNKKLRTDIKREVGVLKKMKVFKILRFIICSCIEAYYRISSKNLLSL